MKPFPNLTQPGAFVLGCNYWASHAGTRMWSDWRPAVVHADLQRLRAAGLQLLRVFPLWPDFQPLTLLRGAGGAPVEFRHGEDPLPDDPLGQAGLSAQAMARFAEFLDLAQAHHLKLIVGLLTGWMSGRLFVPPALEGRNVLTDPLALRWELRLVRTFVRAFRAHPAIAGWDLGNECNCLGSADRDQAWAWTAAIAGAIRVADPAHPVVSGLHSLSPRGAWRMQDQGELTDLLTTHPYPLFTPHCDQDPLNTIRPILHSTAESRFYADLGGQPCLCQEIGTLGPLLASEALAADFLRTCLFSLWANDCHGLLWWCAHDQDHLTPAPYDWHAVERELGLLRSDGSAKPVLGALSAFGRFLDGLPFDALPPRRTEAVCMLTEGQDHWGVAYSAFLLAKQAGFDLTFQYADQPLRSADLYLLPCLAGLSPISKRRLQALLEKVSAGATLYVSLDSALPDGFEPLTGLEPQTRERRRETGFIQLDGLPGQPQIPCGGSFKIRLQPTRAAVLGREADGNPAFTVADYGKGRVYFLAVPLELLLTQTPGAFHTPEALPCWQVYRHMAAEVMRGRVVTRRHPLVAVTEHPLPDNRCVVVAINQSPAPLEETLTLQAGWALAQVLYGNVPADPGAGLHCRLGANDAAVMVVAKTG